MTHTYYSIRLFRTCSYNVPSQLGCCLMGNYFNSVILKVKNKHEQILKMFNKKVKKVIEHKAGYYYQNRFNNNGYFSSNGLFVTYSMSLSMLMIEQIGCLTF